MAYPTLAHEDHEILGSEYCSGYVDVYGQWNTGFYCPQTGSNAVFCCGTPVFKYCCTSRQMVSLSDNDPENETPEDHVQMSSLPIFVGVLCGLVTVAVVLTIITACFYCSCCVVYKKRRERLPGALYRLQENESTASNMYSNLNGSVATTPLDADWTIGSRYFPTFQEYGTRRPASISIVSRNVTPSNSFIQSPSTNGNVNVPMSSCHVQNQLNHPPTGRPRPPIEFCNNFCTLPRLFGGSYQPSLNVRASVAPASVGSNPFSNGTPWETIRSRPPQLSPLIPFNPTVNANVAPRGRSRGTTDGYRTLNNSLTGTSFRSFPLSTLPPYYGQMSRTPNRCQPLESMPTTRGRLIGERSDSTSSNGLGNMSDNNGETISSGGLDRETTVADGKACESRGDHSSASLTEEGMHHFASKVANCQSGNLVSTLQQEEGADKNNVV